MCGIKIILTLERTGTENRIDYQIEDPLQATMGEGVARAGEDQTQRTGSSEDTSEETAGGTRSHEDEIHGC